MFATKAKHIAIGATTRQCVIESDAIVRAKLPLLAKVMPFVGHTATRARGTVGGSIVNGDPAAEIVLVAVTLGATLVWRDGGNDNPIAATDFFLGPMVTALPLTACLAEARFPVWSEARVGVGFHEINARQSDFAFVSAAAQVALDGEGRCIRAAIGIGAATAVPLRLDAAAEELKGKRYDEGALRKSLGAAPGSRVINIADREGDIYELFAEATKHPQVGVLVRARHDRRLEKEEKKLWDFISAQPVAGEVEITVPRKPGVASHKALLEIRFAEVVLKGKKGHPPIKLWIVEAWQSGVSAKKALCWRLITNQPVTDLACAVEKVQWYRLRWRIEEFHRVLKTGCKAESRQLEKVERLKNVLALDMIIAWRILELTRASRQNPEASATELLTEEEVTVLCQMCDKLAGKTSLTLREAVRAIAQWGGFLARKSDGEPGPMTLWSGLQRLHHYTIAFSRVSKSL